MASPPHPGHLIARIREIARDSARVVVTDHAAERMEERDIIDVDLFRILRSGHIVGSVEPGRRDGDWTVKVVYRLKGSRDAGVVTVVLASERLVVVTVEWEDCR